MGILKTYKGNTSPSEQQPLDSDIEEVESSTKKSKFNFDKVTPEQLQEFSTGITQSETPTYSGLKREDFEGLVKGPIDPYNKDIAEERAIAQSGWKLAGNFLGQGATEFLLGSVESAGYFFDFDELLNQNKQAEEGFDNWFSKGFRKAKEYVQEEAFPIYQTEKASEGSFWDRMTSSTFWASQGKTIGTTLSLLIPSTMAAKGLGTLGKLMKLGKIGTGALQGVGAAIFSRKAESAMEANQTFNEQYQTLSYEINPITGKLYTDQEARKAAGEAAASVFKSNLYMLPTDIMQYTLLLKPFKGVKKSLDTIANTKLGKGMSTATQIGSEALEEAYQYTAQQEAISKVKEGVTPFGLGFGDRLSNYITDPEFQTSAALGGLMGGLFDIVGPVARKINEQTDKLSAAKIAASNFGDLDSFMKIDNKLESNIILKNYNANRLDKLDSELDSFAEGLLNKQDIDKETIEAVNKKVKTIKEDIKFIQDTEQSIKFKPVFANKPELIKEYSILQWENKKTEDRLKEVELEEDALLDNIVDERDTLVYSLGQLEQLTNLKQNIEQNETISKEEQDKYLVYIDSQIEEINKIIEEYRESVKEKFPDFKEQEYTTTGLDRLKELYKERIILHNHINNTLKPQIAAIENLTEEEAAKRENKINKTKKEKSELTKEEDEAFSKEETDDTDTVLSELENSEMPTIRKIVTLEGMITEVMKSTAKNKKEFLDKLNKLKRKLEEQLTESEQKELAGKSKKHQTGFVIPPINLNFGKDPTGKDPTGKDSDVEKKDTSKSISIQLKKDSKSNWSLTVNPDHTVINNNTKKQLDPVKDAKLINRALLEANVIPHTDTKVGNIIYSVTEDNRVFNKKKGNELNPNSSYAVKAINQVKNQPSTTSLEDKIAEINKRRQKELKSKVYDRVDPLGRVEKFKQKLKPNQELVADTLVGEKYNEGMKIKANFVVYTSEGFKGTPYAIITSVKKPSILTDGVLTQSGEVNVGYFDSKEAADKWVQELKSKDYSQRLAEIEQEINARYDAEIAKLKGSKRDTDTPKSDFGPSDSTEEYSSEELEKFIRQTLGSKYTNTEDPVEQTPTVIQTLSVSERNSILSLTIDRGASVAFKHAKQDSVGKTLFDGNGNIVWNNEADFSSCDEHKYKVGSSVVLYIDTSKVDATNKNDINNIPIAIQSIEDYKAKKKPTEYLHTVDWVNNNTNIDNREESVETVKGLRAIVSKSKNPIQTIVKNKTIGWANKTRDYRFIPKEALADDRVTIGFGTKTRTISTNGVDVVNKTFFPGIPYLLVPTANGMYYGLWLKQSPLRDNPNYSSVFKEVTNILEAFAKGELADLGVNTIKDLKTELNKYINVTSDEYSKLDKRLIFNIGLSEKGQLQIQLAADKGLRKIVQDYIYDTKTKSWLKYVKGKKQNKVYTKVNLVNEMKTKLSNKYFNITKQGVKDNNNFTALTTEGNKVVRKQIPYKEFLQSWGACSIKLESKMVNGVPTYFSQPTIILETNPKYVKEYKPTEPTQKGTKDKKYFKPEDIDLDLLWEDYYGSIKDVFSKEEYKEGEKIMNFCKKQ